jgi:hypothetical protein
VSDCRCISVIAGYRPFGALPQGTRSFIDQLRHLWNLTNGRVQYRLPAHYRDDEWVDALGVLRQHPVPHRGPPGAPQGLIMDVVANAGAAGYVLQLSS